MSVSALRKVICSAGLSDEGCVEKSDLRSRALEGVQMMRSRATASSAQQEVEKAPPAKITMERLQQARRGCVGACLRAVVVVRHVL